jgi:hypothetical protein
MNKLDKQFAEMMKDIRIESPSSDFKLKVMSRIMAEAAVRRKPLLQDYQPVISKRTWIILLSAFALLVIYTLVSAGNATPAADSGLLGNVSGKWQSFTSSELSKIWEKGAGIFSTIPPVAYLIILSSLALWTLDSFLTKFRYDRK